MELWLFLYSLMWAIMVIVYALAENKILAVMQWRHGANATFLGGGLQSFVDGFKCFFKNQTMASGGGGIPILVMASLFFMLNMGQICSTEMASSISYSLFFLWLLFLAMSYVPLLVGYKSTSIYSKLGAFRSFVSNISYDLVLFVFLLTFMVLTQTSSFHIAEDQSSEFTIFFFIPILWVWVVSGLAECHRAPFDFQESESELVCGYMTEMGGVSWSSLMITEYFSVLVYCHVSTSLLVCPDGLLAHGLIVSMLLFSVIWIRAASPRLRVSDLLLISWKLALPMVILYMTLSCCLYI